MTKTVKDIVLPFLPHTLFGLAAALVWVALYFADFKQDVDMNTEFRLMGDRVTTEDLRASEARALEREAINKEDQSAFNKSVDGKLDIIIESLVNKGL